MTQDQDDPGRPPWDDKIASELIGAIVIVGMTYVDAEGQPTQQFQYHGIVTEADPSRGIAVECHGEIYKGETAWLPPHLQAFTRAKPGEYRLRSTGEVVTDPDYTTQFTVTGPRN